MRKLVKKLISTLLTFSLAAVLIYNSPVLVTLLFGESRVEWVSERFSETLKEKSELVVFEAEVSAADTITQEAWLIGTVQSVEIPYTFHVRYAVDLSAAKTEITDQTVIVSLPRPEAKYQQLTVDEEKVKKQDWLYPLTPERYSEIKAELEQRLLDEFSNHPVYLDQAWDIACQQLENMFSSLTSGNLLMAGCELQVVYLIEETPQP